MMSVEDRQECRRIAMMARRSYMRERDRLYMNRLIRNRLESEVSQMEARCREMRAYMDMVTSVIIPQISVLLWEADQHSGRSEMRVEFEKRIQQVRELQEDHESTTRRVMSYQCLLYDERNQITDYRRVVPVEFYGGVEYITRRFQRMRIGPRNRDREEEWDATERERSPRRGMLDAVDANRNGVRMNMNVYEQERPVVNDNVLQNLLRNFQGANGVLAQMQQVRDNIEQVSQNGGVQANSTVFNNLMTHFNQTMARLIELNREMSGDEI